MWQSSPLYVQLLASGGVGGSGTTNYVPKFTAGTTLGNSQIFDNGTKVGIGTASPSYKLQVNGDIYANGGWLRVAGTNGLYFTSYGGGWYMEDSTWIRSYNSKQVYMSNGFDTGTGAPGVRGAERRSSPKSGNAGTLGNSKTTTESVQNSQARGSPTGRRLHHPTPPDCVA
jgi:hypothetical protein